jgi:glycosyltransferase involved in cell wall biosynthesis
MKKVIEVVASLAVGGAERVALEVAAGLATRHAGDWRAELCVVGPEQAAMTGFERSIQAEAEKRGVPVHRVTFSSPIDRAARRRLRDFLIGEAVDLVHIHNRPRDWQVAALGWMVGVPTLYTIHKPYVHDSARARLLYTLLGFVAPQVVCVSHTVARQAHRVEHLPLGKIRVIYNGIRLDVFHPLSPEQRMAKRAELGWESGRFVWLCVARLHEQKAQKFLLDAMARLPSSSRAQLMLAGEGPLEVELKSQAARLGLDDRVRFLGPRFDVPELLGAADGYACSSREEGHPLSLLEAMACGLPIVAPRLPAIEEIAIDGVPVFFGPKVEGLAVSHDPQQLADALLSVERNPEDARLRARDARDHVANKFSLDAMIDRHAVLYDEILSTASQRHSRVLRQIASWAEKLLV